ncbi:MAG: hypothetical protein ACD_62C00208G0001 [uncultured bacterium]|nr:MAG: hypothetical protein ACD_62C00208G0001 [uncultured bacterium]HLD45242.1 hypothetical protein [bacterium]
MTITSIQNTSYRSSNDFDLGLLEASSPPLQNTDTLAQAGPSLATLGTTGKTQSALFVEDANAFLTSRSPANTPTETAWVNHSATWRITELERRTRNINNELSQLGFNSRDYDHRLDKLEGLRRTFLTYQPEQQPIEVELIHHRPYPPHPRPYPAPYEHDEHRVDSLEAEMRRNGLDFIRIEGDYARIDDRIIRLEQRRSDEGFRIGPNPVHDGPGFGIESRLDQLEANIRRLEGRVNDLRRLSGYCDDRLRRLERIG